MKTTIKKYFFAFLLLGIFITHSAEALTQVKSAEFEIKTLPATNITSTSAVLHGLLPKNNWTGGETMGPFYYFQYGTSNQELLSTGGTSTAEKFGSNGNSALVTNLKPNTTYYFGFVRKVNFSTSAGGPMYDIGEIQTFTTLPSENKKDIPTQIDRDTSPLNKNDFFPKTLIEWLLTTVILLLILIIVRKGFMKK
ncbi:fibronectin type III domain-containing protein [Candidatus Nomurabacteria bacterium]|nr:fibronectin type III domain-containing protein [Candidatus Nomurabacteria bacterium]